MKKDKDIPAWLHGCAMILAVLIVGPQDIREGKSYFIDGTFLLLGILLVFADVYEWWCKR